MRIRLTAITGSIILIPLPSQNILYLCHQFLIKNSKTKQMTFIHILNGVQTQARQQSHSYQSTLYIYWVFGSNYTSQISKELFSRAIHLASNLLNCIIFFKSMVLVVGHIGVGGCKQPFYVMHSMWLTHVKQA